MSGSLALCLLVNASELYVAITLVNLVLLLALTGEGSDYAGWFVAYELSIVTTLSALTLESRSYRRLYALVLMLSASFLSSAAFYGVLHATRDSAAGAWSTVFFATAVVLVKTPCYPASVWLPEAHVEAS